MHIGWFILMCIGIGFVVGTITIGISIGAIFKPWLQSKGDPSTVIEKPGREGSKKKKILLAYETKFGSAAKIADKIWEVLTEKGYFVDMKHIPNIMDEDISNYDAYILGGATYWSMYMRNTREFFNKNLKIISSKPTALYMVCGKMANVHAKKLTGGEEKWRQYSLAYLEPMLNAMEGFEPVDIGTFAGEMFIKRMNLGEFIMMQLNWWKTGMKQGDYVEYDKVAEWAASVPKALKV